MTSLECLGALYLPAKEVCDHVAELNIVSHSLQELHMHFVFDLEKLEAMVSGLRELAPSLATLYVDASSNFCLNLEGSVEEFVNALTGLRQHPTLEKLEFVQRSGVLEPLKYFLKQANQGGGAQESTL